jgi:hypothetical protein
MINEQILATWLPQLYSRNFTRRHYGIPSSRGGEPKPGLQDVLRMEDTRQRCF